MQELLQVPNKHRTMPVRASLLQADIARIRNDGLVQPASAVDADAGASREVLERAITPHLLDDVG